METILRLDIGLFRFMNSTSTAPFLDVLMPYVTEKFNFLGVVIVAAALILVLGKRKDRLGLLVLVAAVLTADFLADGLKHLFMRARPCNALEGVRLLAGCGDSYSLPSGHATNIFAGMVFLTARYKKFFPAFLTVAAVVAYSRVYVGVHYPLDIAAGAALGTCVAIGFHEAEKRLLPRLAGYFRKKRGGLEA